MLFLDEPIHMASVLVLFIFSPDILVKQSSMSKLAWSDFSEPSRKRERFIRLSHDRIALRC